MEPLLVHPDPPPPELARLLDLGGYAWKPVADERVAVSQTPDDGWGGAIVVIDEQSDAAWALCRAIHSVTKSGALGADVDLKRQIRRGGSFRRFEHR